MKAAIGHLQVQVDKEEVEGSLLNHHNLPPHLSDGRYRAIQHLRKHPTPPLPWQLAVGNVAPYDEFKPKILKEVDDFHGILTTSPDSF